MRIVLIALLVVAMSTAGIYAATAGETVGETASSDCTGTMTISPATSSSASVGWLRDSNGQVTAAEVTWTPGESSNYNLVVVVDDSTGSLSITTSGTATRTDSVSLSRPVSAEAASALSLAITQDVGSPTGSSASVGWLLNSSGQVTAAVVAWTPNESSDYTLSITLEDSTGSLSITNSGTSTRIDTVPLSRVVSAKTASSANLCLTPD